MSDQPQDAQAGPQLGVIVQYLKDLSFENPGAPGSLAPTEARPEIEVGVDVQARQLGASEYEVTLTLNATAKRGDTAIFVVECVYCGLFGLRNMTKDMVEPVLMIECPRTLFPFARRIVSDATRDGGFPPLMLDPIDFIQLYHRNRGQAGIAAGTA